MSTVGELVPVILFVTVKLLLGFVGVYAELILTDLAESVVIRIGMSYLSRFGNGMSAGCGIPVVNSVVLGNFGIILVSAELSHTCRAVTVAVSVVVRKLSRLGKVVSAGDRMPVIILIGKPAICVVSVVAHYVLTNVTDTVVAFFIYVSCKTCYVNAVSTGNRMPVVICVSSPLVIRLPGMCAHYVLAYVTDTVVVKSVNVRRLVDRLNGVTAVCCVPVVVSIRGPVLSIKGVLAVNSANVTVTVVVTVLVKRLSFYGNYVVTLGKLEPVMGCILFVFGIALGVRAECELTNVTDTVCICVTVGVKSLKRSGNLVLALCKLVPVVVFVVRVFVIKLRMVTHLILTNVAKTVVAFFVYVISYVLLVNLYGMVTCRSVPVSCFVFNPLGFVKLVVAELILTNVTDTVVTFFIYVRYNVRDVIGVTGVSVPVAFSTGFPNVLVKFVNVIANVGAHSTCDAFAVHLVTLSFGSTVGSIVSAYGGMPVLFIIKSPYFFVVYVVRSTYVVFTNVAFAVVVFIKVLCNINSGNVVSAASCMPMFFFVRGPIYRIVSVLVIVVPSTNVTETIVIDVKVITFCLNVYRVITVRIVPVLVFIVRPFGFVCMNVVIIPRTYVADTVVCLIHVSAVAALNVVSTGRCIPVMSSIVGVSRLIGVLMVVIPFANVTNAVVVSILVSFAILGIYVTVTGRKEIVVSFVV